MNLFKKLFGTTEKKETPKETTFTPDNSRLIALLHIYHQNTSQANYKAVLDELYGETAFLLVPTNGKTVEKSNSWETLKEGATIEFKTVFNVDGLLVFGVFTSEETLSKWINEVTTFMAIPAKTVLEIAEEQSFGRIVIDSDQSTMFVLERDVHNQKREVITEDTPILVWMPQNPMSGSHQKQFQEAFAKVDSIQEVYHFGITKNNEQIFLLVIVLHPKTENSILATQASINDGMKGHELEFPLEVTYVEEGDYLLETARQFELFYKK
ncbi:SseB family protein [Flavobacterium sp.]|jgi:hypothetical protein|uniref:SseB family protein n=1 Tax=Flavobacterium sp. TaxID=239 RepID=UPI0037BFFD42